MGTRVVFASRFETLAERFASDLRAARGVMDPLRAPEVVVPNPAVKTWLALRIAEREGVLANVDFLRLEEGIWRLLTDLDPDPAEPKRLLSPELLRVWICAALQDHARDKQLAPLLAYIDRAGSTPAARARALWQLSGRLATNFREYEYQRYGMTRKWRDNVRYFSAGDGPGLVRMEACQMHLYNLLFAPDGPARRLREQGEPLWLSLPQFSDKVIPEGRLPGPPPASSGRTVFLFGLSQVSPYHEWQLLQLGRYFDLRLYRLSLCEEVRRSAGKEGAAAWKVLSALAREGREGEGLDSSGIKHPLLRAWGAADRESVRELCELGVNNPEVVPDVEVLPGERAQPTTLLHQLQAGVRGANVDVTTIDGSLQVAACPSLHREVEATRDAILECMRRDPNLRWTDIAVLTPDLAVYRPVIESVFSRQPDAIPYNQSESAAGGESLYAAAVSSLLSLGQGRMTRRDVFNLVLNPCFLHGAGIGREDALVWLRWADSLGIYHSADAGHRTDKGYVATDRYTWQQGLQRLRLGRIMRAPDDDAATDLQFAGRVPFQDMDARDVGQLNGFSRTIELLLARAREIPSLSMPGAAWRDRLLRLANEFLAVPPDREEEQAVRAAFAQSLEQLSLFDACRGKAAGALEAGFVLEFVRSSLAGIAVRKGNPLTGGVSVASLQHLRGVPFQVVFVLGLQEGEFPPRETGGSLDLRHGRRKLGDIPAPDAARGVFLDTVMAARGKLFLSYVARDLQQDKVLHPSSVVLQLESCLQIKSPLMWRKTVPFRGDSEEYLIESTDTIASEYLCNASLRDRLLCLRGVTARGGSIQASPALEAANVSAVSRTYVPVASAPPESRVIQLRDLFRFLRNPATALLQSSLGLYEDDGEDDDAEAEDEPFYLSDRDERRLLRQTVDRLIEQGGAPERATEDLRQTFESRILRGDAPDGAYADLQRDKSAQTLREYLGKERGEDGLQGWLRAAEAFERIDGVHLGTVSSRRAPTLRFPEVSLPLDNPALPGSVKLAGRSPVLWLDDANGLVHCVVQGGKRKPTALPPHAVLQPLLFYTAALAGPDSAKWLGGRALRAHLFTHGGHAQYDFSASTEAAREYLSTLSADWCATGYDLLPYEVVASDGLAICPYESASDAVDESELRRYADLLIESIEEAESYKRYFPDASQDWLPAAVPADAWIKVRRRLRAPFAEWLRRDA